MRENRFMGNQVVETELIAVLVAVTDGDPRVLTIENGFALPSGPLEPGHRSLQAGLRAWVERQTHHPITYVEQLYTFADQSRAGALADQQRGEARGISISYLALSREAPAEFPGTSWRSWYHYFPWEDQRSPNGLVEELQARLTAWAGGDAGRLARIAGLFGGGEKAWNEELVLQRYELLWEAGLVPEATRHALAAPAPVPGKEMLNDHRRILATAIARLRAKIKYRPVVFELLAHEFTLLELQQTMEALAGQGLHKPNFRRFIEAQELVEETGRATSGLAGRPAKLFRFKPAVLEERGFTGSKLPLVR